MKYLQPSRNLSLFIAAAFVFLVAFGVRFYNWQIEGINPDEPTWQQRIENFSLAIKNHEWQYTFQSLHPAVTLDWLSYIGRASSGFNYIPQYHYPFDTSDNTPGFTGDDSPARGFKDPLVFWTVHSSEVNVLILVNAAACLMVFLLLSKLVDRKAAFLSALLVCLDFYYIASSRVIQMDSLLASFVILTALCAILFFKSKKRLYLILAALFSGLTVLTKVNGVLVCGFTLFVIATPFIIDLLKTRRLKTQLLLTTIINLALYGVLSLTVFFVLYPAMWVQPILTLKDLAYGIFNRGLLEGGESVGGTFFLGRVSSNPGFAYYPLILLIRSNPLSLVAFVAGITAAFINTIKTKKISTHTGLTILFLIFFVIYLIGMSAVAKKSERYIMPIFLLFDIYAGLFLYQLLKKVEVKFINKAKLYLIIILVFFGQFILELCPLSWHYGSYYNPLIGGAKVAQRLTTTGWGEGLVEVADYINSFPNSKKMRISTFYSDAVRASISVYDTWYPSHWGRGDRDADLVIFYINQIQRKQDLGLWEEYQHLKPLKTVTINGIAYAYIYQGLHPLK